MKGLTNEEILQAREKYKKEVEILLNEDIELIDSFMTEYPGELNKHIPIWYLSKSIEFLSQADIVYFGGEWEKARGCNIEHEIAIKYGLDIIKEK